MMHLKRIALPAGFAALAISQAAAQPAAPVPVARNGEKPRNVIFILSDDHRYDFMGFTGAVPWLQTPALDRVLVAQAAAERIARVGRNRHDPAGTHHVGRLREQARLRIVGVNGEVTCHRQNASQTGTRSMGSGAN